jgi:hypothetical protein
MIDVAALFIDPRGPYPRIAGVDCWDVARDARRYDGPLPVVAHPPCGPWGRLTHLYRGTEHDCAPIAVRAVQRVGGVLEHPADSRLWAACDLPRPGAGVDKFGGQTVAVKQVEWGHACVKPTWIYAVGCSPLPLPPFPGRAPTRGIWYGRFERSGHVGPRLLGASKEIRRRTPPEFAAWLVSLARQVRLGS